MLSWARLARTHCPECGSRDLEWIMARDLPWFAPPHDRLRVFDLISWTSQDAEAWGCVSCGMWGIFDTVHGENLRSWGIPNL